MLPRLFDKSFRDPLGNRSWNTSPRGLQSPAIISLNCQLMNVIKYCDITVLSQMPLAEDVIYVLPQLPRFSDNECLEINYKIRVNNVFPECVDRYNYGLFNNSLETMISNFDKFDMLYIPPFADIFQGVTQDYVDAMYVGTGDFVHSPAAPPDINGALVIPPAKVPSKEIENKQKQRALRSQIFK